MAAPPSRDELTSPSFLLSSLFKPSHHAAPSNASTPTAPSVVVTATENSTAVGTVTAVTVAQPINKTLRTSTSSEFSLGGESIFTPPPPDPFGSLPNASFSGSLTELPSVKQTSAPPLCHSLSALPSILTEPLSASASSTGSAGAAIDTSFSLRPSASAPKTAAAPSVVPAAAAAGPVRRPTLVPGGGRRPSAAAVTIAPPPVDLAAACARPINPATGVPETATEARERRRSSKKPQQVARLRATFSKYPKFRPSAHDGPPSGSRTRLQNRPHLTDSGNVVRYKAHSMHSIFDTGSTITTADNEEVVRCIAVALRYHIKRSHTLVASGQAAEMSSATMDIFDERLHPVSQTARRPMYWQKAPPLEDVYKYVSAIFNAEKLAPECAILSLAYTERLLDSGKVLLLSTNWRRLTLSCIILASKVWEDQAVWNVDFVNVFPRLSVADLNRMEKIVLSLLQYNVSLHASLYAKYYFELRDLSDLDDGVFPLKPVDPRTAEAAQTRVETTGRRKGHHRARSLDSFDLPPAPT